MLHISTPTLLATQLLQLLLGCLLSLSQPLVAQDGSAPPVAPAPVDPDLPQPFDPRSLTDLLQNPPFTRTVNLSDSLMLTGMTIVNKKPMATLLDRESKKTYIVTDTPNAAGWRIAEAIPATKLSQAQVKLQIGAEIVAVRYSKDGITETIKDGKTSPYSSRSDRGPAEGDKGYRRSMRGPSEEDRRRFEAMSPTAQEKVKNLFRDPGLREKMMSMNDDERRTYIRSQVEKIESEDKKNRK
jgi:hypothetical protein